MLQQKFKIGQSTEGRSKLSPMVIGCLLVAVALAGLAAFLIAPRFFPSAKDTDWQKNCRRVTRGAMDVRISATGIIRPVNQVKVSPKFTGLLKKLLVEQGDFVKAGQLIALMDDSNLLGQVQAARSAYQVAQANYEKIMTGNRPQEVAQAKAMEAKAANQVLHAEQAVSRARAQLKAVEAQVERDETNARRLTELASQGAISDQERLNAATQARVSRSQLQQCHQEIQQAEAMLLQSRAEMESARQFHSLMRAGFRKEDVRAAHDAMLQAEGNLRYLESQLNDTRIRAPFDGFISQKYTDEGAIVTPTTASAALSATSSSIVSIAGRLEMVASVSETDINSIDIGQQVEIIANAYPDLTFHGTVTRIAPEAIVTQNVTTFEVHATIDDDPGHRLMSGMNVNAVFLAGRKENVLLIPTACITSKQGKTGVLVPDKDGNPEFKPVKIGPTGGTETAVLSGLNEGDYVFLGLSKAQLQDQGYIDESKFTPGMGGGSKAAPKIPKSLGAR